MFRDNNDPHALPLPLATFRDWVTIELDDRRIAAAKEYAAIRETVSVADGRRQNHGFVSVRDGKTSLTLHEQNSIVSVAAAGDVSPAMRPLADIDTFGDEGTFGMSRSTPLSARVRDEVDKQDLRFREKTDRWNAIYTLADYDGDRTVTIKGWLLGFECVLLGKTYYDGKGRPECWYVNPAQLYRWRDLRDILRRVGPNNTGWIVPPDVFPALLFDRQGFGGRPWSVRLLEAWDNRK